LKLPDFAVVQHVAIGPSRHFTGLQNLVAIGA
jgi:hypothetical protein